MPQYTVEMQLKSGGHQIITTFGADRTDVQTFVKRSYRRVLKKITSCRQIKPMKGEPCAACQQGDQMQCAKCARTWDLNDSSPCPQAV